MDTDAWDWWIERLPDLVSPAEGLGRWDPRSAPVLERAALLKARAASRRPAERARLDRLLGVRAPLPSRDPRGDDARAWLAEAALGEDPRRSLRLLAGLRGPRADYYRGAAAFLLGRWSAAAASFAQAGASWRGAGAFLPSLLEASALLRRGDGRAMLAALERARAAGADAAALHWLRAYALDLAGRPSQSPPHVEAAMRRFSEIAFDPLLGPALRRESLRGRGTPPSERTLALLGGARRRGAAAAWALVKRAEDLRSPGFSRYEQALRLLERGARRLPRSPWAWAYLGRARDHAGDAVGAGVALAKAARLAPEAGWIRAWRGNWLMRRGSRGALAELDAAVRLQPGYPFAHAWRGGALRRAGRWAQARRELETAALIEPGYEWTFHELFELRRRLGQWKEACAMLTEAHEREMKFVFARRGRPEELEAALKELSAALRRRPGPALARAWRAWVLAGLGRYDEAAREASAVARRGGPAFAWAVLGEAQAGRGRMGAALAALARAAREAPCAAYLGSWGDALLHAGRVRQAESALAASTARNGTIARFQCKHGWALLALRRDARAAAAFERALGLHPAYTEALAGRAEAARRLGRVARARALVAAARRLRPDCPWTALAASRLAKDDVAACAQLLKAVEHGGELPPGVLAEARARMGRLARRARARLGP